MNAPSVDIDSMLVADVTVNTTKYPNYRGAIPTQPPNCTILTDVPGGAPQLTMDNAKYENPSIQIRVRCTDYDEGWAHISTIVDSLHGRAHETWGGAYYSVITCLNGPGFMEREEQKTIFVANFNIQRR